MIVFRIEHRDDPTCGGFRPYEFGHHWGHLPTPNEDRGIWRPIKENEVCGATPEKFAAWWPPEGELLVEAEARGYHAVALEVPDDLAVVGHHQVIFPRSEARIVGPVMLAPDGKWVM